MDSSPHISVSPKKVAKSSSEVQHPHDVKKCSKMMSESPRVSPLKRRHSTQGDLTLLDSESKKKRHHRRKPNKRRRHKNGNQSGATKSTCQKQNSLHSKLKWKHLCSAKTTGHQIGGVSIPLPIAAGKSKIVLRPTKVPLLNAPRNSTQFIIDDHESSDLVWNFEAKNSRKEVQGVAIKQSVKPEEIAEGAVANQVSNAVMRRVSSDSEFIGRLEDEDTFFMEYSERDFQIVYETAHQEEIAAWDRKKLVEEIASLELRHKELVKVLARLDPEIYVDRLQREIGRLRQQNRFLKSLPGSEASSVTSEAANESDVTTSAVVANPSDDNLPTVTPLLDDKALPDGGSNEAQAKILAAPVSRCQDAMSCSDETGTSTVSIKQVDKEMEVEPSVEAAGEPSKVVAGQPSKVVAEETPLEVSEAVPADKLPEVIQAGVEPVPFEPVVEVSPKSGLEVPDSTNERSF